MALHIVKTSMDSISGHTTMHLRVMEKDSVTGGVSYGPTVVETIDHKSLTRRYGCPNPATPAEVEAAITRWLADRHPELLGQKRALEQRGAVVAKLAGRVLEFGGG